MPGSRPFAIALAAIAATGVALGALALANRRAAPSAIELRLPEAAAATPSDGQMKVYVAGAVQRPGVYTVHPGDRVADAIEAAGGPADDADTLVVNFARRLRDEDHIIVPRQGEAPPAGAGVASAARRTDINAATAAALEQLPGIGPARARSIVDSRAKDGPFAEPADLVKRKLVPQSVFASIENLIDVRP